MTASETRRQIVVAADRLFYERGFEATSFADIAGAVRLSRGNFYYHFRTKDEILQAVIAHRIDATQAVLDAWEAGADSPAERILSFVRILITNRTAIMAHGCPVGTLCNELSKLDHAAKDDAVRLFTLFRGWLVRQFTALGREADADALALHVLMRSQGVATLATAFRDEAFVRREIDDVAAWLTAQCPPASPPASRPHP
ncbi:helix-turn-helix domain containing protein [Rhodoplanes sp. TEM]|uniref:Helix-turn-helix domain containing protein n=1 Tax=Rhodoplanes tepidamans TaxID=200616 RepID=A0ABT5J8J0_RHOTP|nr:MULTISPECIES: TetR/AcrR family transcriptional regulator [Rhodoplanes]MDC7785375.1 helix-turn-helix domain containing protein [Rhodoplanes tepidamans]MDC7984333.1 helix-turn-helix domain containing protein [Rhodoplanes sp. TEM]MDQ0353173.1 AcrR family transcriptional regulator [Rhodoplanes tepidamans]